MNQQSKLFLTVLVAAFATTVVFAGSYVATEPAAPIVAENAPVVTEGETVVATPLQEPAPIEERRVAPVAEPAPIAAPVNPVAANAPPITVTEQRLTEDERIQVQVMEKLANNPTLTGKIGVVTRDQVVNLTGYVMTNGMVMRAGRDANSIVGVRYVVNEIRPKVGPITN